MLYIVVVISNEAYHKSGDRVRVARSKMKNLQATFARAIRVLKIHNPKNVTAEALRPLWDYRSENLKLPEAQAALQAEIDRQRAVRGARRNDTGDVLRHNEGKYAKASTEKTRLLAEHAAKWWEIYKAGDTAINAKRAYALSAVSEKTSASYPYHKPQFALVDGIVGRVDFDVADDWEYYDNKYGRPKTTVGRRGVSFTYPQAQVSRDADGEIKVELKREWQSLDRFAGNWFFDVFARQFGKNRVEKNARKVQLHECFSLRLERKIAGVEIYARVVANTVYDLCAVAGKETFHAATAKEAVAGLRDKRESRIRFDSETLRVAFRNGKCDVAGATFCSAGVRNFCADNGIDENAEMSRAELRSIVLKNRKINCEKYSQELCKIGIKVNCK